MANAIWEPVMTLLVESRTNLVRFDSLPATHQFLLQHGFQLVDSEPRNGGYHLFYVKGHFLLRIKTHGDPSGPRRDQAHLSMAMWSDTLEYADEWGKADRAGLLRGNPKLKPDHKGKAENKPPAKKAADKKIDFANFAAWASATHFNFKVKNLGGGENLPVKHGNA